MQPTAESELIELHRTTTSTSAYLREIWERRDFLRVVPATDMRARNMDNTLGQLWLLITPAMMIAVYYVVFGVILKTDRGTGNFFAFLVVGLLHFQLTQRTVTDAASAISRNSGLIRTIQFPRALVVLAGVLTQLLAFLPAIGVVVVILLITGFTPEIKWLLYPVILGAQLLLHVGASFVAARVGFAFSDVSLILPHIFRLLLYGSGAIFAVDRFIDNETIVQILAINPIYDLLYAFRWALMDLPMAPEQIVGLVAWCLVLPVFGMWWFRRAEARYGMP